MGRHDDALVGADGQGVAGKLLALGTDDEEGVILQFAHQQLLAGGTGRHRVVVAAVADQAVAAAAPVTDQAGVIGGLAGQRLQPLLRQPLGRHGPGGAMHPPVGHRLDPRPCLVIQVGQVGEGQPGPEGGAHIADPTLDLALRLRPIRVAGLGGEAIVGGEVEEGRIPMDGAVGVPFQHDGLEVVIEDAPGAAAQRLEGVQVAAQEGGGGQRDGEFQVDGARPAEGQQEGVQLVGPAAMVDGAEMAPVHLGLLAGCRLEAQRGLGRAGRAQGLDEGAHQPLLARIALRLDLMEELLGVDDTLGDALLQVGLEGVELAGAGRGRPALPQQRPGDDGAHRLTVMAGEAGDVTDGHAALVQLLDHEAVLHLQHGCSSLRPAG